MYLVKRNSIHSIQTRVPEAATRAHTSHTTHAVRQTAKDGDDACLARRRRRRGAGGAGGAGGVAAWLPRAGETTVCMFTTVASSSDAVAVSYTYISALLQRACARAAAAVCRADAAVR